MNHWSPAPPRGSLETATAPRVSIGLPVYNGERFLAGAIASILAQTYTDFELIICDNASTDRTGEICRGFASKDPRVRYHRQPRNLGATANFNRCFELASGAYFKWAADDDLLEPRFLEACVRALDDDPGAVLSQSLVKVVDEADQLMEVYDHSAYGTSSLRPSERLSGRMRGTCLEVFGLIRSDVLRDSALIQSYIGSDRALLVDLALRGRFALVPEPLFINRDHLGRCTRITRARGDRRHIIAWYDTQLSYQRVLSTWQFHLACLPDRSSRPFARRAPALSCAAARLAARPHGRVSAARAADGRVAPGAHPRPGDQAGVPARRRSGPFPAARVRMSGGRPGAEQRSPPAVTTTAPACAGAWRPPPRPSSAGSRTR
jgi:hypothetical protein